MSTIGNPGFRSPGGSMSGFGDMLDERLLRERIIWLEGEVRDENSDRIAKQLQVLGSVRQSRWPTWTSSNARASTPTYKSTKAISDERSSACSTFRSWATCAAPATFMGSNWSRTR